MINLNKKLTKTLTTVATVLGLLTLGGCSSHSQTGSTHSYRTHYTHHHKYNNSNYQETNTQSKDAQNNNTQNNDIQNNNTQNNNTQNNDAQNNNTQAGKFITEQLANSVMTNAVKSQLGNNIRYNGHGAFIINNNQSTLNANVNVAPYATNEVDRKSTRLNSSHAQ